MDRGAPKPHLLCFPVLHPLRMWVLAMAAGSPHRRSAGWLLPRQQSPRAATSPVLLVASEDVTGMWRSHSEGDGEGGSPGSDGSALDWKRSNVGVSGVAKPQLG